MGGGNGSFATIGFGLGLLGREGCWVGAAVRDLDQRLGWEGKMPSAGGNWKVRMGVRRGLSARLGRLFAVQVVVIGAATVAGIFVTQAVVEDLLTRQALALEAEHYWERRAEHDGHPLPDTANMRGYLGGAGVSLPAGLEEEEPGFRRLVFEGRSRLVHVSERGGERLYLVFNAGQVSDLAFYFGILPLSVVLLLMYVLLFVAYRWSRAALSPLVRLARELETVDFDRPGGVALHLDAVRSVADAEVATMVDALDRFTSRLDAAIERERLFTRDAGHELRTPLAVFKGSLDLLERNAERPSHDRRALARMRRTADDMESLLETLLTLAHEEAVATDVPVRINDIVAEEARRLADLAEERSNRLTVREPDDLQVLAPEPAVRVVVANLLRNALAYTENGDVEISVEGGRLRVSDTGVGMSQEELARAFDPFYRGEAGRAMAQGHGLGLSIVRRLTAQYGWTLHARSSPGHGTSVEVRFSG